LRRRGIQSWDAALFVFFVVLLSRTAVSEGKRDEEEKAVVLSFRVSATVVLGRIAIYLAFR
jgi:hypothetical protein